MLTYLGDKRHLCRETLSYQDPSSIQLAFIEIYRWLEYNTAAIAKLANINGSNRKRQTQLKTGFQACANL